MPPVSLEDKVFQLITRDRLAGPGDRVLAAISGGADSTALLAVLHRLQDRLGIELSALHIHHRLRGAEADADAGFCRNLAGRLGVPYHQEDLSGMVPPAANREEWMRERRWLLFRQYRHRGFGRIALGHQRDDQAETLLLRLFRGAGLTGLGGMRSRGPAGFIRPLLTVGRQEILQFLQQAEITYREDGSNRDLQYRRNRIRHRILPFLQQELEFDLRPLLARTAVVLQSDRRALEERTRRLADRLVEAWPEGLIFRLAGFRAISPRWRQPLLRELLRRGRGDLRRLEACHIGQILDFLKRAAGGRQLELPSETRVEVSCGWCRIGPARPRREPFDLILPVPGEIEIPGRRQRVSVSGPWPPDGVPASERLQLRPDRAEEGGPWWRGPLRQDVWLPWPGGGLRMRSLRPGDRVAGPGGSKKVKKLFLERRIPVFARPQYYALVNPEDEVLWIPGLHEPLCYNASKEGVAIMRVERRLL